ncbi:hypothetical protein D3C87_161310 [compost metagenome]
MLKVTIIVVKKRTSRPNRNIKSANFSKRSFRSLFFLIERKERMELVMNKIIARAVVSSINVLSCIFDTLMEVSTIKHSPSKVADVFSMCGDLFSSICLDYSCSSSFIFLVIRYTLRFFKGFSSLPNKTPHGFN